MAQAQKSSRPRLLQAMIDAFRLPDLRRKLLFTLGILIIFRFAAHVPIPGVNSEALANLFATEPLLGMLDLFSGGALKFLSVAAMGVYPYITATIIMQLLVPVIPRLQALQKEGEAGQRKLNLYSHWLTVPTALLQGYGQLVYFQSKDIFQGAVLGPDGNLLPMPMIAMLLSMTAGTVFLVWLGERITENGIGNGVSIIIFGGIVTGLPSNLGRSYLQAGAVGLVALVALMLAISFFIVYVSEAVRRIPIQYSRSLFRGGKMYRQSGGTYIPMRVNTAGMIPLIFAYSILMLPAAIASYFATPQGAADPNFARHIVDLFGTEGALYWGLLFVFVIGFTFFYTMVIFQQQNLAAMLQKQGGFVPGIRPGRPTADYLNKVITRITWGGAIFLALVAVAPILAWLIPGAQGSSSFMLISSAGMLIVVGVVLDTMRQIEAQLLMRQYEGFLK